MKKFRGTALFTGLALVLAGYTYWEFKKAEMHAGDSAQEKRLFYFVPDEVKELKISHPQGGDLVIARDGDEWKMAKPLEDLAEKSAVEALLYSVMIQKGSTFTEGGEGRSPQWSQFGLDPAGSVIEIKTGKKTETLSVSSKNAYDGSYYIRQGDELMLGDHGLAQVVQRDPAGLRSKKLFRDKDSVLQSVQVQVSSEGLNDTFKAVKDGDKWTIDPKPGFAIDMAKVESWLSSLHALNAADIASESLSAEQRRDFLLLRPSFLVKMRLKANDGHETESELKAGQNRGDDVYVQMSDRPTVYKLNTGMLSSLRVSREFFRDGKSPFKLPVEQVRQIVVGQHEIEKDGAVWKLKNAKDDEVLNQDKFALFMQNLAGLEAQAFLKGKEPKGFKPENRVVARDGQGQVLLELNWGDEFKPVESWNKGMTFRFVKTNLEKEVLGVNATKITSLADSGLVIHRADKKTDKR